MNGLCRIGGVLGLTDPTKLFIHPLQCDLTHVIQPNIFQKSLYKNVKL